MKHRFIVSTWAVAGLLLLAGCDIFVLVDEAGQTSDSRSVDAAFEATAGAKAIALGDLNNDGLTDVASISGESQPVQIHLRNPSTLLFDTYTIAGGAPLSSLVDLDLADLNRDGRLDIVVLASDTGLAESSGEGALVFLFQEGGGNPGDPEQWTQVPAPDELVPDNLAFADGSPTDVVIGDLDGANGLDVVVASSDAVWLFLNPGDAEATDWTAWDGNVIETSVASAGEAALADLDRDGDQDVVVCDPGAQSFNLRWLQNPQVETVVPDEQADPTYLADVVDPLFEATAGAKGVSVGDINNDGLLDVASISDENQPVQIHLQNSSTGKFDMTSIAGGGPLARMIEVELADFNADGKLDMAVLVNDTGFKPPPDVDRYGALVILIQGSDPARPASWTQVDPTDACYGDPYDASCSLLFTNDAVGVTDMVVADFTGDQLPDVALTSNEPDETTFVHLITNPGAARATDATAWTRTIIAQNAVRYSRVGAADIDKDGDMDVVASLPESKTWNLSWYENNGTGTVWTFNGVGQQQGGGEYISLADIDGDGYVDVAASAEAFGLTQWFRHPGADGLTSAVPWNVFNIGRVEAIDAISQVRMVDLDNDGLLECFVTAGREVVGFRQEDDIEHAWDSFPIVSTDPPAAAIGRVAFADFDGDGQVDFLAPLDREGLMDDRIVMYSSVASSQWRRRLIAQQHDGADHLAVGDIDGDGNVDVAAAGSAAGLTQWFRNPGPSALAYGAAQVPWGVFNIASLDDSAGEGGITQLQLVDSDGDGVLECFLSASGYAFEFYRPANPFDLWSGGAIFRTDPVGEIGPVRFADIDGLGWLDVLAPINRGGLTQDQIIIFYR